MDQADSVHSTPPINTSANNPPGTPADSAGPLYVKTPIAPEEIFKAIGRLRKEARDEIDRLIRFLDSTENHMELEPDNEGDEADAEPSLGSFDRMTDQSKAWRQENLWAVPVVDAEQDASDAEPALGSLDGRDDQTAWAAGGRRDLELDPAESGIVDLEGLLEQIDAHDRRAGVVGMV